MIARLRRIIAGVMIPFVLLWSIMMPRQAYAFAPVGAAPIAIVGTLASGAVVPLLVGATIAGIAYWAFKDLVSLDEVRVPAVAGTAGTVPAPVAASTVSPAYMCEAVGSGTSVWNGCNVSSVTTVGSLVGATCTYHTVSISDNCPFPPYQRTYDTTAGATSGCPSGYTLSGAVCNLSNPHAAIQDNKQDFTRSGAVLAPIAGDQSGALSGTTMTSNTANDTVVIAGKDSAGNAMQGKIIALPDGGSTVEIKTQMQSASGQSYVQTQTFQTSSTGDVVSAAQTATAAQLSFNPTTKQYTETAAPVGTVAPDLGSASSQPTQFPSDYARQGEAASAAQSISNTLGPKLDKLVETSPAPVDPTVPDPSGYTDFGTTFQSLLGWQLPGHTSQCPTASFNTPWNTAYTIDSHCQLITNHWSALQAAMAVVWTIVALFIVLRA